ncbi:GNAT family N-acetyltransferase [Candidatus Haliotispira prima]|uniref:GNAT family N-acetyltransferase n=1 Tax=Candidatus Haliotispira prima TaxID=3034016 RepID=A0ABY8MI30_9SPIO|nr:GNAT family N-acetyltransferase [Candidatus Haliotispira prima]
MVSTNSSDAQFRHILDECEESRARLRTRDFTTDKGLCLDLSKQRLPPELRGSNCRDLELYLVQQDAKSCLQEIGRLREQAFRRSGGGTWQEVDLDHWDHSGFWQLLCIDLREKEVCGAYRLLHGAELYRNNNSCDPAGQAENGSRQRAAVAGSGETGTGEMGSVHSLFDFSPLMLEQVLPRSIELGRSFINEKAKRSRLALPLMFETLGQILCRNAEFALGKMTFYPDSLDAPTLWLLHSFLEYYWGEANNPLFRDDPSRKALAWPREGLDFRLHLNLDLEARTRGPDSVPGISRPHAAFRTEELDQLAAELRERLPERFDRNALHHLLLFFDDFYERQESLDGSQDSEGGSRRRGKRSKNVVLRAMALFLKYVSLLRDDFTGGSGMHVFGGAVNPHFGNVIEFMSLVEVKQFRQSNLERWSLPSD